MREINTVNFSPEYYGDDPCAMWEDISKFMQILAKNDYIFVTHQEDFSIVVVEFDYADRSIGSPYPVFLSPDEEDSVVWDRDTEREKIRQEVIQEFVNLQQ